MRPATLLTPVWASLCQMTPARVVCRTSPSWTGALKAGLVTYIWKYSVNGTSLRQSASDLSRTVPP